MSTARLASHGLALWLVAGCASTPAPAASLATAPTSEPAPAAVPPAVLDAMLGGQRTTVPFDQLAARVPLAPEESFKIVELGRDASSSHHVVALRGSEPVHRHDLHDLLVVTLEGHGSMLLGAEERAVGPHSIVYIPRGTVHSMRNHSGGVLYGYAVFTPPFDGKDRVPVAP